MKRITIACDGPQPDPPQRVLREWRTEPKKKRKGRAQTQDKDQE